MINETIQLVISNATAIPLQIITENKTNWSQFSLSLAITGFMTLWMIKSILGESISNYGSRIWLKFQARKLKQNVVVVKHTESGFWANNMIDQNTHIGIHNAMKKFKGKPFKLILHTPGGQIFSSQAISRLLQSYPGKIQAIVPFHAMSGGTFLALSCKDGLKMGQDASLGLTDPQIGSMFGSGSAKAWDKLIKFKGKKVMDQNFISAFMGRQYQQTLKEYMRSCLSRTIAEPKLSSIVNFFVDGEKEHGYPLLIPKLNEIGLPAQQLTAKEFDTYAKIILKMPDGVTFN